MSDYKETFKVKSTEELFTALEDSLITISTIKASKFFSTFETQITFWEKTLSEISETTELILQVLDPTKAHFTFLGLGSEELDVFGEYIY